MRRTTRQRARIAAAVVESLEQRRLFSGLPLNPTFTPSEVRKAFGLDQLSFGNVPGDGTGQTIAIIAVGDDPDIGSDANTFSSTFNLPQFNEPQFSVTAEGDGPHPTLIVENQYGYTNAYSPSETYPQHYLPPPTDPDIETGTGTTLSEEESLDVEWAHTVAPQANIVVIETNGDSPDSNNIAQGLKTARSQTVDIDGDEDSISVVSESFGAGEANPPSAYTGSLSDYDSIFTAPSDHEGITIVASTGDDGSSLIQYPAVSPNVLAVGGTSVTINGDGSFGSETAWSDSGGGYSTIETMPEYQMVATDALESQTDRTIPDVSWLADPNTGVKVLDSYRYVTGTTADNSPWFVGGGTSLAAPMWAGLIAIADQGLALRGVSSLAGYDSTDTIPSTMQTLPLLYSLPSSDFYDVTSGSNGAYSAGTGYDLVTGLGSPNVVSLVNDLASTAPTVIYVDHTATGSDNGSSWANADTSLATAITAADGEASSSNPVSIYVAQGTYIPGTTATSTFTLDSYVSIFGGFKGGSSTPNVRNVSAYPTILSGNLGSGVNAYHVVTTGSSIDSYAVLNGLTIEDGDADGGGSGQNDGGGIYIVSGSPTLTNCAIINNTATADGGGLYVSGGSPTLSGCAFSGNVAADGGAFYTSGGEAVLSGCTFTGNGNSSADGGAIYDASSAAIQLTQSTFTTNSSADGGALYITGASPSITDCIFDGNSAVTEGGAIDDEDASPAVVNSIFSLNKVTSGDGGAVFDNSSSHPDFTNSTWSTNSATSGGAIYNTSSSTATLVNCITWGDTGSGDTISEITNGSGGTAHVSYSDVEFGSGVYSGTGNMNCSPGFVRSPDTSPIDYGDLALAEYSPCIDEGTNGAVTVNTDLAGNARIIGPIVDMGAYEYTILYVDQNATSGGNNGKNWANAYLDLQSALSAALAVESSDASAQLTIEVADGTYKPGTSASATFKRDCLASCLACV